MTMAHYILDPQVFFSWKLMLFAKNILHRELVHLWAVTHMIYFRAKFLYCPSPVVSFLPAAE